MASPDQMITLASLGRPFRLGMVYDCRRDILIPGVTLWDPSTLQDSIDRRPQHNTQTQIAASDSLSDKASLLDISASLRASFLGDLVEVEGSAKYLKDTKKSAQQARVTLSYSCTTHFEQLTMGQLATEKIKHPDVFDKGIATHVVTGILYGARAIFVFDQQATSSEEVQDIHGNLRVQIKKIPLVSVEGEGKVDISEKERETVKNFNCTFYGDFQLKKNPTDYMEAIALYAALPEMVGAGGENAVPMKVWLYPLSLLDSRAAKLVREISSRLIGDCEKAVERLLQVDMRTNDLLGSATCARFPAIREKLQAFRDLCQQYKLLFQKQLARALPTIRGGGAEEAVLADLLRRNEQLPFSPSRLSAFLGLRHREMRTVERLVRQTQSSVSSQDAFMEQLFDAKTDTMYAFAFTSLQAKEPYFEELAAALEAAEGQGTVPPAGAGEKRTPWFEDEALLEGARNAALLFAELSHTHLAEGTAQFAVTSVHDESNPGAVIFRYQGGSPRGTRLHVLPKPSPPEISRLSAANVELVFKPAESTEQPVTGYELQYRPVGKETWVSRHAPKATHTVTLPDNDVKFEFRYAVESAEGRSPFSDTIASYNGYGFFLHEQKC